MAQFVIREDSLVLHMTPMEHVEGFHADITVPLSQVREIRATTDPWADLRGIRAPGTGLPGVIAVGTRRGGFGKDFAAVHGSGPGVVIDMQGGEFSRFVVSCADPDAVVAELRRGLGRSL